MENMTIRLDESYAEILWQRMKVISDNMGNTLKTLDDEAYACLNDNMKGNCVNSLHENYTVFKTNFDDLRKNLEESMEPFLNSASTKMNQVDFQLADELKSEGN